MHIPDPVHHLDMRDQLGLPRDLLEIICSQDKVLFYSSQFIRCSRFIHTTAWCLAVAQYIERDLGRHYLAHVAFPSASLLARAGIGDGKAASPGGGGAAV